jgi:hypothetical protein
VATELLFDSTEATPSTFRRSNFAASDALVDLPAQFWRQAVDQRKAAKTHVRLLIA